MPRAAITGDGGRTPNNFDGGRKWIRPQYFGKVLWNFYTCSIKRNSPHLSNDRKGSRGRTSISLSNVGLLLKVAWIDHHGADQKRSTGRTYNWIRPPQCFLAIRSPWCML
jgi:hypothetical protein